MLQDILGVVGVGMSIYGGLSGAKVAKQEAGVSQAEAATEQSINSLHEQTSLVAGRRAQMETVRNMQRARAMSIQAGVSSGSQNGSGLQGALGSDTDQGLTGLSNINQKLQSGQQLYGYTGQINADKQQMASLQGQAATDQAWSSLGGSLIKSAPMLGNMGKGVGGFSLGSIFGA